MGLVRKRPRFIGGILARGSFIPAALLDDFIENDIFLDTRDSYRETPFEESTIPVSSGFSLNRADKRPEWSGSGNVTWSSTLNGSIEISSRLNATRPNWAFLLDGFTVADATYEMLYSFSDNITGSQAWLNILCQDNTVDGSHGACNNGYALNVKTGVVREVTSGVLGATIIGSQFNISDVATQQHKIKLVKSGNTFTLYKDDVLQASGTDSTYNTSANLILSNDAQRSNGNNTELRVGWLKVY